MFLRALSLRENRSNLLGVFHLGWNHPEGWLEKAKIGSSSTFGTLPSTGLKHAQIYFFLEPRKYNSNKTPPMTNPHVQQDQPPFP